MYVYKTREVVPAKGAYMVNERGRKSLSQSVSLPYITLCC